MNIRPLADRIIVKRTQEPQTTKGGIIIPDTAKEKPIEAIVVAVGSGKKLSKATHTLASDIKQGDKVLFGKYAGTELKVGGEEVLILREDDVLAVVSE